MRRRGNTRGRNNNKNNMNIKKFAIPIGVVLFIVMFFSIIFSLFNLNNNKIIKGVKIGNVDISGLSQDEAIEKLNKWKENSFLKDIKIKYQDFESNINIEDLRPDIDIEKTVREACKIGKTGNIVKDNYEILFSMLFGKKIELGTVINDSELNKRITKINEELPNALKEGNYYIEENSLVIKKGKSGIKINNEKFKEFLIDSIESENKEIEIPVEYSNAEEIDIEKIYKEIYKKVENAYISQDPIEVHPEVNGVDFAISIDEAKKILEEEKDEYIIPIKITLPEVTIEDLGREAFPHLLGTFSTTYSMANKNRVTNLELASEKIDGTIVLPGEIFSYNKVVGQRTIAAGYKEAAVYSGGKVVDGIGGGICQISSTLYNAAIYANLEITERSNHRFLTSYVEAGRDATVSWGTVDFCFKNTRKYPIKISSSVKNGVVTLQIYGMKEETEYEIVIENKLEEIIPYTTKYVKDYTKDEKEEEIKQYGANGAKSTTYKITKYNGSVVSRSVLSEDTYSPLERIIVKGGKETEDASANIFASGAEEEEVEQINPNLLELINEL